MSLTALVLNIFFGSIIHLFNTAELYNMRPEPFTVWPFVVNGGVSTSSMVDGGSYIELRAAFFNGALAKNLGDLLMELQS
jgi:hypothetical protein